MAHGHGPRLAPGLLRARAPGIKQGCGSNHTLHLARTGEWPSTARIQRRSICSSLRSAAARSERARLRGGERRRAENHCRETRTLSRNGVEPPPPPRPMTVATRSFNSSRYPYGSRTHGDLVYKYTFVHRNLHPVFATLPCLFLALRSRILRPNFSFAVCPHVFTFLWGSGALRKLEPLFSRFALRECEPAKAHVLARRRHGWSGRDR